MISVERRTGGFGLRRPARVFLANGVSGSSPLCSLEQIGRSWVLSGGWNLRAMRPRYGKMTVS
jgi:hypothetical protein